MIKAAGQQGTSVSSVSFVDALRWLAQGCQVFVPLHLTINPHRPGRVEPRVRKRRPKEYDLMKQPRDRLRQKLLHKSVST